MKADPAVQQRLLDLADVDAELSRLAHRRRTLPEHAALTEAEAAVRTAKDKLVEVETVAGDLDRDIRRLERDVEGVRTRVRAGQRHARRGRDRRQAGQRPAARAGDAGPPAVRAGGRGARGDGAAGGGRGRRGALAGRARDRGEGGGGDRRAPGHASWSTSTPPRPAGSGSAPRCWPTCPPTCWPPTRSAAQQHGVGAALLRQRRCQACRLELDRTAVSELRAAPADEIVHCSECGVILVRTAESGL